MENREQAVLPSRARDLAVRLAAAGSHVAQHLLTEVSQSSSAHAETAMPLTAETSSKQAPEPRGNLALFIKSHLDLPRRRPTCTGFSEDVRGRPSELSPGVGGEEWFLSLGVYTPKEAREESKERMAKY